MEEQCQHKVTVSKIECRWRLTVRYFPWLTVTKKCGSGRLLWKSESRSNLASWFGSGPHNLWMSSWPARSVDGLARFRVFEGSHSFFDFPSMWSASSSHNASLFPISFSTEQPQPCLQSYCSSVKIKMSFLLRNRNNSGGGGGIIVPPNSRFATGSSSTTTQGSTTGVRSGNQVLLHRQPTSSQRGGSLNQAQKQNQMQESQGVISMSEGTNDRRTEISMPSVQSSRRCFYWQSHPPVPLHE